MLHAADANSHAYNVTLPALQKNFVNIFSCLPGNFALKNGGDFW